MNKSRFQVSLSVLLIFLTISVILAGLNVQLSSPFTRHYTFYQSPVSSAYPLSWKQLYCSAILTLISTLAVLLIFQFRHRFLVTGYSILMCVFMMILISYEVDQRFHLELEMVEGIRRYNPNRTITILKWDATHLNLKCCGYDGYRDWLGGASLGLGNPDRVPDSCCVNPEPGCGFIKSSSGRAIYHRGCYDILWNQFQIVRMVLTFFTYAMIGSNLMVLWPLIRQLIIKCFELLKRFLWPYVSPFVNICLKTSEKLLSVHDYVI